MGALLGALAWNGLDEPRRSVILRQAKWLVVPGYAGCFSGLQFSAMECSPGGVTRCSGAGFGRRFFRAHHVGDPFLCAKPRYRRGGSPSCEPNFPYLPEYWSQVYRHYDEVPGSRPTPARYGSLRLTARVYHVSKTQLEFRAIPPRRGTPWWQPRRRANRGDALVAPRVRAGPQLARALPDRDRALPGWKPDPTTFRKPRRSIAARACFLRRSRFRGGRTSSACISSATRRISSTRSSFSRSLLRLPSRRLQAHGSPWSVRGSSGCRCWPEIPMVAHGGDHELNCCSSGGCSCH